jgi:hypothetical protein
MEKPEQVVQAIEEALQDEGLVLTRHTDLDAINLFLSTAKTGTLHVVIEAEDGPEQVADIECFYGRTLMGDYIIKWHSDSIEDVMTNGKTHLKDMDDSQDVYFTSVREIFFGETKAFVVCTPLRES